MSSYGVTSTSPLTDIPDDPEVIFTDFLVAQWNDVIAGVPLAEIDFGYEPDVNSTKRYIIKLEELNEDTFSPDLPDKYTQEEFYLNCHIWERDSSIHKTTSGMTRWKLRRYVQRVIKQNCRDGISVGGMRFIKHMYLIGAGNIPEQQMVDWHHTVILFKMVTWVVTTI